MVKSMTGFGAISLDTADYALNIEIKTLNNKYLDIFTKLPNQFSDKEIELKNLLGKSLERGKISLILSFINKKNTEDRMVVNRHLVAQYYEDLKTTAELLGAKQDDLMRIVMTMPQAFIPAPVSYVQEEIWKIVSEAIGQAIKQCDEFRVREGKVLYEMFKECIAKIADYQTKIESKDPERVQNIRQRMYDQIREWLQDEHFDKNRFEQELVYYVEKLDINEEKVRLRSHLVYFLEVLDEPISNGKKLNFIAQEIGREINTIGSKANDAQLQHWVVGMKEELEKIKEQLNNVI